MNPDVAPLNRVKSHEGQICSTPHRRTRTDTDRLDAGVTAVRVRVRARSAENSPKHSSSLHARCRTQTGHLRPSADGQRDKLRPGPVLLGPARPGPVLAGTYSPAGWCRCRWSAPGTPAGSCPPPRHPRRPGCPPSLRPPPGPAGGSPRSSSWPAGGPGST